MSVSEVVQNNVDLYAQSLVNSDKSKSKTQHVIKAHITALVSALGGLDNTSTINPPPYKLGINALAVLKDLKKWLRFDQNNKKLDVNLAIGESNLITFDILHILSNWEQSYIDGSIFKDSNAKLYNDRIASMCLELLVPITWPLLLIDQESTMNQVVNYHKLKQYQLEYKKAMMNFNEGLIFRAIIRLVIPVISLSKHERSVRDNSILNLVFLFFRNILSIEPDKNTMFEIKGASRPSKAIIKISENFSPEDISLDLLIKVFAKNKVLKFLLLVLSNLGKEFDDEILGFSALECLYYLTNNIPIKPLFIGQAASNQTTDNNANVHTLNPISATNTTINSSTNPLKTISDSPLAHLLAKEKKIKTKFIKETASRHSAFGSLLSFDSAETGRLAVSGQRALMSTENTMEALNKAKKWNTQKQRIAVQSEEFNDFSNNNLENEYDRMGYLTDDSKFELKNFADSFVDAGFNQFIKIMCKKLYTNMDELVELHCIQYCLVSAWFLEFERHRRLQKEEQEKKKKEQDDEKLYDFGAMLVEEFSDLHNKSEVIPLEQDKGSSEKDVDDAENIDDEDLTDYGLIAAVLLNENITMMKLFLSKEEENSDVSFCHAIVISFKEILSLLMDMGQSKFQNDIEVSLTVFKKIFTDNAFLVALVKLSKNANNKNLKYILSVIDLLDIIFKMLEKLTKEDKLVVVSRRKHQNQENQEKSRLRFKEFNFNDFFVRFVSEKTINSYFRALREYENIDPSYIKKVIKFYHKIIFVYKFHTILLRLDFVMILHEILKNSSLFARDLVSDLQGFFKHYMKIFRQQLEAHPSLCVEMLFPKLNDSIFFTHEKASSSNVTDNTGIKAVKPIEFKPSQEADLRYEEKIGLLIIALMKNEKSLYLVRYLMDQISRIIKDWTSASEKCLIFETSTFNAHEHEKLKKDILRSANFRLLLHLCGFLLPEAYAEKCVLKESMEETQLTTILDIIRKYSSRDYVFNDDEDISTFIRKIPNRQFDDSDSNSSAYENDNYNTEGSSSDSSEEEPTGIVDPIEKLEGVIDKKSSKKKRKNKKKEKKRSTSEHNNKKKSKESVAKQRYVSALYIDSEDDLSDEEADQLFFEKERKLREMINANNGIISKEQYKKLNFQFQGEGISLNKEDLNISDDEIGSGRLDNTLNNSSAESRARLFVEDDDYDANSESDNGTPESHIHKIGSKINQDQFDDKMVHALNVISADDHADDDNLGNGRSIKRRKILVPDSDDE